MATSPHLTGKLRDALGNDAGMELVGIVDKAASDISELRADVAELRHEMRVGFERIEQAMLSMKTELKTELKAEMAGHSGALRAEMAAHSGALRAEMAAHSSALRAEMAAHSGALRAEMAEQRANLAEKIDSVRSDLMKWSFVFWVGAVVSITMLAVALQGWP
jgi:hypothetical protein